MQHLYIWVTQVLPTAGGRMLSGHFMRPRSEILEELRFEGVVVALSPNGRVRLDSASVREVHVEGGLDSVYVTPSPLLEPPYLLTSDTQLRLMFHGSVGFRPAPGVDKRLAQEPVPVAVMGPKWFGVLEAVDSGVVRRRVAYRLTAFTADSGFQLASCDAFEAFTDTLLGLLEVA